MIVRSVYVSSVMRSYSDRRGAARQTLQIPLAVADGAGILAPMRAAAAGEEANA